MRRVSLCAPTLSALAVALAAALPAQAQVQTMLGGIVDLTVPEGWQRLDVDQAEVWVTQTDADTGRAQSRVMIRVLDARAGAVTSHGASVLALETPPIAQTLGELPVWRMRGEAAHGAAPGGTWYADTVVTQVCAPDAGPVAVTFLDDDPQADVVAALNVLGVSFSTGMVGCGSDSLADEVLAMIAAGEEAQANRPLEPFPLVPAPSDWATHERFGLTLRTPMGLSVRHDHAESDELRYAIGDETPDRPGMDVMLRIQPAGVPGPFDGAAPRSPEMAALLSEEAEMPMQATGQQLTLGDRLLDVYSGTGTEANGQAVQGLIAIEAGNDTSADRVLLAARTRGFAEEAGFTVLNQVLASLAPTDLPIGAAQRATVFDGRGTVRAPAGLALHAITQEETVAYIDFSTPGEGVGALSLILTALDPNSPSVQADLAETYVNNPAAQSVIMASGAAWLERDAAATQPGQQVVYGAFQRCIDGQFVMFSLEENSVDTGQDLFLLLSETDLISINPALPITDCVEALSPAGGSGVAAIPAAPGGKDPVATGPSADTLAWEQAQATGTPDAVFDYLARFPTGAHVMDAQAWLTAWAEAEAARAQAEAAAAAAAAMGGVVANLGDDDTLGRAALADGSPEALYTYLKAYPEGRYVGEVRATLAGEPLPTASK